MLQLWANSNMSIFLCKIMHGGKLEAQLLYNQLSHLDTRHFVIIECRHLANGCVLQCGCIGLMLFHNISCLDTIICYTNTIGIVPAYACTVCDALVASCTTTG